MHVKIFSSETGIPKIEKDVNQWLSASENKNIKVKHIKQSCAGDGAVLCTVISIWYEN